MIARWRCCSIHGHLYKAPAFGLALLTLIDEARDLHRFILSSTSVMGDLWKYGTRQISCRSIWHAQGGESSPDFPLSQMGTSTLDMQRYGFQDSQLASMHGSARLSTLSGLLPGE